MLHINFHLSFNSCYLLSNAFFAKSESKDRQTWQTTFGDLFIAAFGDLPDLESPKRLAFIKIQRLLPTHYGTNL